MNILLYIHTYIYTYILNIYHIFKIIISFTCYDIISNIFNVIFIYFRLNKRATMELIEELIPFMPIKKRKTAIPPQLQVINFLNILLHLSYFI